jgi:hypothetical protein
MRLVPVKNASITSTAVIPASRIPSWSKLNRLMTGVHAMSDLAFVILTGAFFALTALVVRGVEKL